MASFFSRKSSTASSLASGDKGTDAPQPTSVIFTTPPEGVVPKKKWEYDEGQLAKVGSSAFALLENAS